MDEAESAGRAIEVGSNLPLLRHQVHVWRAAKNLIPNAMMHDMQHTGSTKQAGQPTGQQPTAASKLAFFANQP